MFIIFMLLLGLCLGSLFYVIVYRMENNESWVKGRSRCDTCGHPLKWHDLIPLLSFILLRGKCGYCKAKINNNHFKSEFLLGLGFFVVTISSMTMTEKIIAFVIVMVLGFNAISDMHEKMTHTLVIYGGMAIVIILKVLLLGQTTLQAVALEILLTVMFALMCFLLSIIASRFMGAGDFNIMVLLFLCCKPYSIILFVSTLASSLFLMLEDKKPTDREMVAFVPFLYVGYLISILVGD